MSLLVDFGRVRLQQFIAEQLAAGAFEHDQSRGCLLATVGINDSGYSTIKKKTNEVLELVENGLFPPGANQWTTIYLHRASWVAANNAEIPEGLQVSHLCDNPACFLPAHLTTETGQTNRDRRFCRGEIRCPHHGFRLVVNFCQHQPRCIKPQPSRDEFRCCVLDHFVPPDSSDDPLPSSSQQASQAYIEQVLSEDYSDLPAESLDSPPAEEEEEAQSEQAEATIIAAASPEIPETSDAYEGAEELLAVVHHSSIQASSSPTPLPVVDSASSYQPSSPPPPPPPPRSTRKRPAPPPTDRQLRPRRK